MAEGHMVLTVWRSDRSEEILTFKSRKEMWEYIHTEVPADANYRITPVGRVAE